MEELQYHKGDLVSYRQLGIFQVKEIQKETVGRERKQYYVLESVEAEKTTVKLPEDSPAVQTNMQPLLSREEIDTIIKKSERKEEVWISDYKKRSQRFDEILKTGRKRDLLRMMKLLALERQRCIREGKKFGSTDQFMLERAENMIVKEFSYVLQIDKDKVIPYIIKVASEAE